MNVTPKMYAVYVWNGTNQDDIKAAIEQAYGIPLEYQQLNSPFDQTQVLMFNDDSMFSVGLDIEGSDRVILLPDRPQIATAEYITRWYDEVPE